MSAFSKLFYLTVCMASINCSGQQSTESGSKNVTNTRGGTSKFHACNYDGSAYEGAEAAQMNATEQGEAVVEKILSFTGLPQNFKVTEGPVPNAAAVILQESDGSLGRYIIYNKEFMQMVDDRTKNNWAGISILAHEIGHHLSGHTLLPGGSQPSIELEADKFSGYVLYKMGAKINDAQLAMNTLVGEEDGPTHPGKSKRLKAILDGWKQACGQSKGDCETGENTASSSNDIALQNANPQQSIENISPALPKPNSEEIPLKFDRFVYDEANLLTDEQEKEFGSKLAEIANACGAEVVILCPKSLNGMTITEYSYAMMDKMRIGKMDLANGAVFTLAEGGQLGFFIQPGLYWNLGPQLTQATIDDMLNAAQEAESGDNAYQALRYGVAGIDVHLNTGVNKWKMDYPTLADAKKDGVNAVRKITRVVGTVDEVTDNFVGDGIKRCKFTTAEGEAIYIHVMEQAHGNIPVGTKLAIVGRLFDMQYSTVIEVMSVEKMKG